MARPKTSKDNQVEKIGSFVVDPSKTLEENFAMLKTQTKALEEYKRGLEKENLKKQAELKKQALILPSSGRSSFSALSAMLSPLRYASLPQMIYGTLHESSTCSGVSFLPMSSPSSR